MKEKSITTLQFAILVFMSGMAIKMFMLPALMLKVSGKDSVLVMGFYLAVELVNLVLLVLTATRNPDKTYYEILQAGVGKIISKIIIAYFTFFLIIKALLIFSEIKVFFSVSVYDRISWQVMIIPLIGVCFAFAQKSLRAIGRSAQVFFPLVIVSAIVLSLLLLGDVPLANMLPFCERGWKDIINGVSEFPVWFGDVSLLVICLGNIKQSKRFPLFALVARVVSIVLVLAFSVIMFATYANIAHLVDYGHNVSSMTQYSLVSQGYGRFDYLVYCVWLLAVLIKVVLIFYVIVKNIQHVFDFFNKPVVAGIVATGFYILTAFVLTNENSTYGICTSPLKYFIIFAEFCMPALLFILSRTAFLKAVVKKEGTETENGQIGNKRVKTETCREVAGEEQA